VAAEHDHAIAVGDCAHGAKGVEVRIETAPADDVAAGGGMTARPKRRAAGRKQNDALIDSASSRSISTS